MRDYREKYYPSITLDRSEENIERFFKFMYERHMIWHRRFIEKLPRDKWTEDPILKVTKYTNIYRELDRGTLWFLKNIGEPYIESKLTEGSFKDLVWKTIIYRLCNRIETFEEVGFPDWRNYDSSSFLSDKNSFCEELMKITDRGSPVMTSAHLSCPTPAGYTKVEGFVRAINDLHKKLDILCKDIQVCKSSKQVFNELMSVLCVGNFIAYEVLCDLIYCEAIGYDNKPFTLDDWANVGPGAKEGIRLLFPSTKGKQGIYDRMVELRDDQEIYWHEFGLKVPFYEKFTKNRLSLRSIEHSLCEMQKFFLQNLGLGKQRMKFRENDNRIVEKTENEKSVKYKIVVTEDGTSVERKYL